MSIAIGIILMIGIVAGAFKLIEDHDGSAGRNLGLFHSGRTLVFVLLLRVSVSISTFGTMPSWLALALLGIAVAFPLVVQVGTSDDAFKVLVGFEVAFWFLIWISLIGQEGFGMATGIIVFAVALQFRELRQLIFKLLPF